MDAEETVPDIIRVRCRSQAYYRNQMRGKDSVINFYTEDMDKGTYRAGPNKGKAKPPMPKWAQVVPPGTPLTVLDSKDGEDVTTLSQMSRKGTPAQQKEAQKVKDDRKKLEDEKIAFEEEKKVYKASIESNAKSPGRTPEKSKKK